MHNVFNPLDLPSLRLVPSPFRRRFDLNRKYMMSLASDNLLQNFYLEAGLWAPRYKDTACHGGWEAPTCQVRGHFLGHWLSGAARTYAVDGDVEIKARADHIVSELARCQKENGGEWAGSIPENYLNWVARGKPVWAPHYTLHKTLMGLYDMFHFARNEQALDVMIQWARWFSRWSAQFSRQQMDDILDVETGGMLEAWANLYGVTQRQEHLDLVYRYDRPRLFNRLLAGEDALTNWHANTTIPEAQGAARAWEVTGDRRWRDIVEAYWKWAVTLRGYFATGGQTCGEVWTPPGEQAARLGDKNQEHCVVYNMMRLAEYLLRWTGDAAYADYWERNLYNGILAQQHPDTGLITYFLPLEPGAVKKWGTPTEDFWCCHGTLVQAQTLYTEGVYYDRGGDLAVCQYIPTELAWTRGDQAVKVTQKMDPQAGDTRRPSSMAVVISVDAAQPAEFALNLRLPWWLSGPPVVEVNGERQPAAASPAGFHALRRTWQHDTVRLVLPRKLTTWPLPDQPGAVAFMDGPVVLAGLCDEERILHGDCQHPETLLAASNEREWGYWTGGYRTLGQERNIRFLPLYDIRDERYTVYFPVSAVRAPGAA